MSDLNQADLNRARTEQIQRSLVKRYRAERRFRLYGAMAIAFGLMCVVLLFTDIISKGYRAFQQTYIQLEVTYDASVLGITDLNDPQQLALADFHGIVKSGLKNRFSDVTGRKAKRELYGLISNGAGYNLRDRLAANHQLLNKTETLWLVADDDIDTYYKSIGSKGGAFVGRMSEQRQGWVDQLVQSDDVEMRFNRIFFTQGDSREPELAGIRGAVMGSLFTLIITIGLSFPIGVAAAVYLEEFAPRNRWTDLIEVICVGGKHDRYPVLLFL